jgi:endonuclease-3 related protein
MQHLPEDVGLYKEYHAGVVNLAKRFCRKTPLCDDCPLKNLCNEALKTMSRKKKDGGFA